MKAAILAGGFGKRLRPLTDDRPKPMIEIAGKPILGWQIEWLSAHGIKEIVLCVGYRKDSIMEYVGSGAKFHVKAAYVVEEKPLGTGGALKNAEEKLGNEPFIVTNGDVLTNLDTKLLAESLKAKTLGSIAIVPLRSPFGVVDLDSNGGILGFREKPTLPEYWINAGVYCLRPEVLNLLPKSGNIEQTAFPDLAREGKLKAVKYFDVKWRSIDTYKDVEEAQKEFA